MTTRTVILRRRPREPGAGKSFTNWQRDEGREDDRCIAGLYVDDFLVMGDEKMINPTLQAIANTWKCSEAQIATETSPVHFCGVEIRKLPNKEGLILSQGSYEQEMLEKWKVTGTATWPQFKTPDPEAEMERATTEKVREAQAMCGALLWLSTRTRPEMTFPRTPLKDRRRLWKWARH